MSEKPNDVPNPTQRDVLRWKILAGALGLLSILTVVFLYPWNKPTTNALGQSQIDVNEIEWGKPIPGPPTPRFKPITAAERMEELRRVGQLTPENERTLRKGMEAEKKRDAALAAKEKKQ